MEILISDFGIVIAGFIVALTFYLISKVSKNMFKNWGIKQKQNCVQICIILMVVFGVVGSLIGGFVQNICFILGGFLVVFTIFLATNIIANKWINALH